MLVHDSAEARSEVEAPARGLLVGAVIVVAVNVVLIGLFFDKAWIPADDGQYVHVADRVASGEVLNADIEELHAGYVHFVHAWSLQLFGDEVVSLRYPLMALMAFQSLLTYAILRRAGAVTATAAALTMSAIGALQIANPTTSLYALTATVGLVGVLLHTGPQTRHRAFSVGVLVGMIFLFRQLTAVFVVMGVLAFLLTERRAEPHPAQGSSGAKALLGAAMVGLAVYLGGTTPLSAVVLFGLFPTLILGWAIVHTTVGNRDLAGLLVRMGAGAVAASVPLIGYHLWHGSVVAWGRDTFVRAVSVGELEHLSIARYSRDLVVPALDNLVSGSLVERVNALYWIAIVFVGFGVGLALFVRLRRLAAAQSHWRGVPTEYALPFVAVFYALVSAFNQIPYYLYLTAGLSAVAGLWMWTMARRGPGAGVAPGRSTAAATVVVLAVSLVAVLFHAGQPYTRTFPQVVAGERIDLVASELPRLGLWIDPREEARYQELLELIETETDVDDVLFAMPNNSDLYFLSDRANGFAFFSPTVSLLNDDELDEFAADFQRVAPAMIVHDTDSHYNTEMTVELLERITSDFALVATIDEFEVYTRR